MRLQPAGAQPVEKPVGNRLQAPIARGLDFDARDSPVFLARSVAAGRKVGRVQARDRAHRSRRMPADRSDGLVVDQPPDRGLWSHCGVQRDLFRCAAEAGALQQMRSSCGIPSPAFRSE